MHTWVVMKKKELNGERWAGTRCKIRYLDSQAIKRPEYGVTEYIPGHFQRENARRILIMFYGCLRLVPIAAYSCAFVSPRHPKRPPGYGWSYTVQGNIQTPTTNLNRPTVA